MSDSDGQLNLIIDTDPAMGSVGGDPEDCFAILLALNSPEVSVEALTIVQGNVPVDHGYANAVHLLDLADRASVPVFAGQAEPLDPGRDIQREWLKARGRLERIAPSAQPPSGQLTSAEFLVDHFSQPVTTTLVTIGPLTNVAAALQLDPTVAEHIPHLVMMGGAATVPGNITPAAEFNIWADPEAADVVFRSGIPVTMVGLDVCEQTHLDIDAVSRLAASEQELGRFAGEATLPWIRLRGNLFGSEDLHLYDSLAVAVTFRPEVVTTRPAWVAIETAGEHTAGETVAHLDPVMRRLVTGTEPNAEVALEVDSPGFEQLFAQRVIDPLLK